MQNVPNFYLHRAHGGFGPPGAAFGAAQASIGYAAERMASGNEANMKDLATAASIGAVTGFFAGPIGSTATRAGASMIIGANSAFYGGLGVGSVERMLNEKPKAGPHGK
ncbi:MULTISPECIES: hypothetical protein [unclassified Bordetella]|uniref:hypothetical protein n=1 Tax=unclassified Bordetella TaxID=2630031 RepID=UPI001326C4C6|nr:MULTISPECIES: hypothetical protein [unclassified Bordetella]MVW72066.1 hypothetical protein [Bordetella sp. 15P40C-2]MVW78779.1 hypothetical protein [Bordetella sp. 02P26C-1]